MEIYLIMVRDKIVTWLRDYMEDSNMKGFVIGVSGGIDSAVTSVLCAETGYPVLAVSMPIHQNEILHSRSELQKDCLAHRYENVIRLNLDLSKTYDAFKEVVPSSELGYANSKARIRMTALYALASREKMLVVGTGNKVEDFGVGFFTKYGDGGVDISPIADLTKTEVYELAEELRIPQEIQDAPPTDGLWEDGRQDEDQLEATYVELEWAMEYDGTSQLTNRQREVLEIYKKHHESNKHKMLPIPVCKIK
jgi:NAD+ synthase